MSISHTGKYDLLRMNARDLQRKGLIPSYSLDFTKPNHLIAQAKNETKIGSREYKCKDCGIFIKSKVLMKEHVKTHWNKEERDNEIQITKVNPY